MSDDDRNELHPAEVAKLKAEAKKLKAEARKAKADAAKAEADATVAALKAADAEQAAAEEAASDENHYVYRFSGEVGKGTTAACIARLNLWDRMDPTCDIEIIFNSPGGSVIEGMGLFDQIAALSKLGGGKHKVTVGCLGYAASMAGILLQAGDVRWIGKRSYLMIHEISAGTGGKIGEIKDDVKFYDAICEQAVHIFVKRAKGKITKSEFRRRWERQDWWILAKDAKRLGFVDEIR
jgi:ATP-dependent Clp endopeptidase proteolytic subunit ClpP